MSNCVSIIINIIVTKKIENHYHHYHCHAIFLGVKCGRCSGTFHLDAIYELFNSSTHTSSISKDLKEYKSILPYIIIPSKDLLEQTHDEWICPLCLQEDTTSSSSAATKAFHSMAAVSSSYYLNEWGCSTAVPWLLHPIHSNEVIVIPIFSNIIIVILLYS